MARRRTRVVLEGVDELRQAFAKLEFHALREAKAVVKESAEDMEGEAKGRAPVLTGTTRDAIKIIYRDGGLSATVGTKYFVARLQEFGTIHQPPQPFLNPAFEIVRPKYLTRLAVALNKAGKLAEVADTSAR